MRSITILMLCSTIIGCADTSKMERVLAMSCTRYVWESEAKRNCAYREYVVYERKGSFIKVKMNDEFVWLDESDPDMDIKKMENK